MGKNKPETIKEIVGEIFKEDDNREEIDQINGPWRLKEYRRSMLYIFDVLNTKDKLVARFVADEETKDVLRAIPQMIAKGPWMKKVLEVVEQDIVMNEGQLTAETFDAVKAINQELEAKDE